ncbi:MAG: right-handed parallel beta-helix repeat-containing protein [Candidatus Bathyarchaeales archaeon]
MIFYKMISYDMRNGCVSMRQKTKLFAILVTVIFSMMLFPLTHLFPAVKATYIEGEITTNTVWTLVDSPFVLSKDVTVLNGVTLTIEPEVEVRFGGNFSLIVNGKLVAVGTQEKPIKFTSNKITPEAGDWGTILINGTSQLSSLKYCIIEYGTNGITLLDGSALVENTLIANNSASGIHIEGNSQTTIQNNIIKSNGDGITLTGNLASSTITIKQNQISLNTHSGILLEAEAYGNPLIQNNTLIDNQHGFYVSSSTSTLITRNYILNNAIGIFYAEGNHEAHFNDIYDNGLGMDVASDATVNAEYNYWGDRSGPYHESLNPYGKGNPVGGGGVNLDFIFFLTASIDHPNTPPTAVLWADKAIVAPNQAVAFIGTDSFDEGRVDQYFFDFGDGKSSGWTTLSIFFHNYTSTGSYIAHLRVMDDFGTISEFASTPINVVNLTPLGVTLSLSNYTVGYNEEISVTAYVLSGGSPVANANVTLFAVKGGSFTPSSGLTNSAGIFTAKFKAPNVRDITNVRIIARASKSDFADGSDHKYLKVIPPLTVHVSAEPQTVLSGEKTTITTYVTGILERPVANASIALSTDCGNLSAITGITDQNGIANFEFTAPLTSTNLTATISVNAVKSGYMSGVGQVAVKVVPKILDVQVTAEKNNVTSEEEIGITVHVEYSETSIEGANVTISSDIGNLSMSAFTDADGNATFTFKTPLVPEKTNITITATAIKAGYAASSGTIVLIAEPANITISVEVSPSIVESEKNAEIKVYVKSGEKPLANATVTIAAAAGALPVTSSVTDENGYCTFSIIAPRVKTQTGIAITVNVEKYGFASATAEATLNVVPEAGGGLPLTTILLIAIPVLLAVVVLVLIKLNVISISGGEESE